MYINELQFPRRVMVTIKQNTGGSLDRAEHTPSPVPCIYQASSDTTDAPVRLVGKLNQPALPSYCRKSLRLQGEAGGAPVPRSEEAQLRGRAAAGGERGHDGEDGGAGAGGRGGGDEAAGGRGAATPVIQRVHAEPGR